MRQNRVLCCHETLTKRCILLYKQSGSGLSVLLYFTLKEVLTRYNSLKFNDFSVHLLNKWFSLL